MRQCGNESSRRVAFALGLCLGASFLSGAATAAAGVCDVVVTLDATPRDPADGGVVTYHLRFCDTTGFGANVSSATIGVDRVKFVPWSGAWTVCPTGTCSSVAPDGQMKIGSFALPASSCLDFELTLALQAGQRGRTICQQANSLVRSLSPPAGGFPCPKNSDDPTTAPLADATCVTVPDPAPGCTISAVVDPTYVDMCAGSSTTLTAAGSTSTGCPGGALAYQWMRDGVDLPGATGVTYTVGPSEPPGAGQLRVRVSCVAIPACVSLSNSVQTNVYAPQGLLEVMPTTVCAGQQVTAFVQNALTCSIDCGNGQPPVATCFTSCTYATAGQYTISASFDDGTCMAVQTRPVDVIALPLSCIDAIPAQCETVPGGPTTLVMSNCSATGLTYSWTTTLGSFDNPSAAEPILTLPDVASATSITVQLTVSGAGCGQPSTSSQTFTLNPAPLPAITSAPNTVCTGQPVSFTGSAAQSPGPYTWAWDFGDGQTSTQQNPQHAYATPGNYTVTLVATDTSNGCTGTTTRQLAIGPGPSLTPSANPTAGCVNQNIAFDVGVTGGAGPFTYLWDFDDGTTSTSRSTSHAYTTAGNYSVTITVTDTTTGCISVSTIPLNIGTACCVQLPAALLDLKVIKAPSRDDATLLWGADPQATSYNVWAVQDKIEIPQARQPPPGFVRPVCTGVAAASCVDTGIVTDLSQPRVYYQAFGVCGGNEGA